MNKQGCDPVRISDLWGCENVKPYYYLFGYNVINANTGHVKTVSKLNTKRGYPYVTLETNGGNKKCLMHHLIALAYIENKPYDVVEHIDDDANNYNVENLMFSNQRQNIRRAFANGHSNRVDKVFKMTTKDGKEISGTIKELSVITGIPRQTIYSRIYRKSLSVIEVRSTDYRKGTDRKTDSGLSSD